MQSTSKFSLLIWLIVALFLCSVLWSMFNFEEEHKPVPPQINVEMHERIVEHTKIKRIKLIEELNHYDTIFLDTFDATSDGLERAINLHRFCDTSLGE